MKFDTYSFKARLSPVILVLLPLFLAVTAWFPIDIEHLKSFVPLALYLGISYLLTEIGRDLGSQKQPELYQLWGGKPSVRILRHSDATLDPVTKARYHSFLSEAIKTRLPTAVEEDRNKPAADAIYDSACKYLLEQTRDKDKYPLIFKELTSYGFRRNLWGMKCAAILICVLSLFASLFPIYRAVVSDGPFPIIPTATSALVVVLFVWWCMRIKPDWVRLPAEAYALRLLAACERIAAVSDTTKPEKRLIITST